MKKRLLTCNRCGEQWEGDHSNTWWFQEKPHHSHNCYAAAVAIWEHKHSVTEDADAPDANADEHLEAAH